MRNFGLTIRKCSIFFCVIRNNKKGCLSHSQHHLYMRLINQLLTESLFSIYNISVLEIEFPLFCKLMVTVFKQYLPKQSFICRKTLKPIGLYFGEFSNDHFGEFILGGSTISVMGDYNREIIHRYGSLTCVCFLSMLILFFRQQKVYTEVSWAYIRRGGQFHIKSSRAWHSYLSEYLHFCTICRYHWNMRTLKTSAPNF